MTDRIKGFVVVLDKDLRTDDVESTVEAIKHIKGVISVEPSVTDVNDHMNRERVRHELGKKLWEVLYPEKKT